jgi:hypothetical protein
MHLRGINPRHFDSHLISSHPQVLISIVLLPHPNHNTFTSLHYYTQCGQWAVAAHSISKAFLGGTWIGEFSAKNIGVSQD